MPRDKTINHEKIIRAATDEFLEYGYDKASMRRIGQKCGITAAAIYRHFDSKEAMFDALVRPAVNDMEKWLANHLAASEAVITALAGGADGDVADSLWSSTEIDMMKELVYPRMTEYNMLFDKAHGSRYESFLDDLVKKILKNMTLYLIHLKDLGYDVKDLSEDELHMLITAYCTALFEPVVHNYSLEDAIKYLGTVEAFFMPGWKNLLGF